jgi:nitroreductase
LSGSIVNTWHPGADPAQFLRWRTARAAVIHDSPEAYNAGDNDSPLKLDPFMNRNAPVDHDINDLLRQRHSPYAFDPDREVSAADLTALFEAARWTMSSYNAQPWRYIVGVKARSPDTWEKVHSVLVEGNQAWARNAPVLALGVVENHFEHNGEPNKAAAHDLGAASALLTLEATARGLCVHQMVGIEPQRAREVFAITGSLEPFTGIAIGYPGAGHHVDARFAERDRKPRERRALAELILAGGF